MKRVKSGEFKYNSRHRPECYLALLETVEGEDGHDVQKWVPIHRDTPLCSPQSRDGAEGVLTLYHLKPQAIWYDNQHVFGPMIPRVMSAQQRKMANMRPWDRPKGPRQKKATTRPRLTR